MTGNAEDFANEAAHKVIGLSDRGEITLSKVEKIMREFLGRGMAAQTAADEIIEREKAKQRGDD